LRTNAILIIALAFFIGCVSTTHLPQEFRESIPKKARAIRIYSQVDSQKYFKVIYKHLASAGFSIANENAEMGTLSTDFKDIDQGTTLRVIVLVEDYDGGAIATLRGQWGITASTAAAMSAGFKTNIGGSTAEDAHWDGVGRPKLAFGELALIASNIDHEKLEYLTE
jgi:hypothetical protein